MAMPFTQNLEARNPLTYPPRIWKKVKETGRLILETEVHLNPNELFVLSQTGACQKG
jgi:uncharacterized protein (DUF2062 family)